MKPNDSNAAGSASATNNSTTTSGTPGSSLTNGGSTGSKNGGTSADLQQTGSSRTTSRENDDQVLDGDDSNQQNPGKMFIGGLSWNTTAEGLRDYFSKFGEVNECMVMRDPTTKRARGFGFITFVEPSSVEKVLLDNDHELDGKKIDPKVAFPKRQQPKVVRTKKVFIGGLSSNTTLEEMKAYFQQFGKIEDAMLMFDKSTQRHRGFGFIVFMDEDVCEKVCEIHFHEINGKMVECKKAQPKEVMLPVQLNKSRAQAARNIYGMTPEQLLAYASYAQPRMPYNATNLLYPGLFNGFSQTFGLAQQSGRSSVSNTGGLNASTSGMFNPRDLAAVQAVAQHQAYEAAIAFANGDHGYYGHQHQQSIPNNYNNKM